MELKILGMGEPWSGLGTKYVHVREYLNTLEDHEIVLFVDGFDVLVVADKETIIDKFLKMNVPFVMSMELNCYPCWAYHGDYPKSSTPFKYINTGSYIGYVRHLKQWLDDMAPILPSHCDQAQTILHYVRDDRAKSFYTFDEHCDLFLPLFLVKQSDVNIDLTNRLVHCLITNSTPCVIHANGNAFPIWDKVYEAFFQKPDEMVDPLTLEYEEQVRKEQEMRRKELFERKRRKPALP